MTIWPTDILIPETRQQRYRRTNAEYRDREAKRDSTRNRTAYNDERRERNATKPFVMWDTEGTNVNATPFLFGSSMGDRIAGPELSTVDMLELVLRREASNPDIIHFIYGGEYDFNMMLRDVPQRYLFILKQFNKVTWNGYRLQHIPRKWFIVSRDDITATIFDVVSFFACPYLDALIKNGIGTPEQHAIIDHGKKSRSFFTYDELAEIEPYWGLELELGPPLMEKTRDAFYRAGMYIHKWHGPGSLARYMLRHHNIKDAMAVCPPAVHDAARYAFCGGRFESFQAGLYGDL